MFVVIICNVRFSVHYFYVHKIKKIIFCLDQAQSLPLKGCHFGHIRVCCYHIMWAAEAGRPAGPKASRATDGRDEGGAAAGAGGCGQGQRGGARPPRPTAGGTPSFCCPQYPFFLIDIPSDDAALCLIS
jgi:hypothetical protein